MAVSRLDRVYRRLVLGTFFADGWGPLPVLRALYANRPWFSNRDQLLERTGNILDDYPVQFGPLEEDRGLQVAFGTFETPMAHVVPEIVPRATRRGVVQLVQPKGTGRKTDRGPLVLHLAGTGDHGFWRRREFIARGLAQQHGISSLILENPFYGSRKPANQMRSCLRNVIDLYVMGACLILECVALLNWAENRGYGPLCLTGISMGGWMASLGACSYPKPVSLVPCLSWSTASVVFTQGVLSKAIPWLRLYDQMQDPEYAELLHPEYVGILAPQMVAQGVPQGGVSHPHDGYEVQTMGFALPTGASPRELAAKRAMNSMMDDFTYLGYYTPPVDTARVRIIRAQNDAYVPLSEMVPGLDHVWRGITLVDVPGGHIVSYLTQQATFRREIAASLGCYEKD